LDREFYKQVNKVDFVLDRYLMISSVLYLIGTRFEFLTSYRPYCLRSVFFYKLFQSLRLTNVALCVRSHVPLSKY
jgi:hypothetical protein